MFVKCNRFFIIANLAKSGGAEVGVADIIGFIFKQGIKFAKRILYPVLTVKHRCQI